MQLLTNRVPVLAIDGPSGSGKGTVSRKLARRLGWHLLDSGALYRLVVLAAEEGKLSLDDSESLSRIASNMNINFAPVSDLEQVFLEGKEVSEAIRTEACGTAASKIALQPVIRSAVVTRQRRFAQAPGLVADGRDMGTIVFPDAILKVFLTASPEERALRRYNQLKDKGIDVNLTALSRNVYRRDRRDAERGVAPLRPDRDARILDSTELDVNEVVECVFKWLLGTGWSPEKMNDD